jgi:hypothetical protein
VANLGVLAPLPRADDDERDRRIAAAQRRVDEIAQQATAQMREVRRELAFPLVHGTQLEDADDAR